MPRKRKSLEQQKRHNTKQEIYERQYQEEKSKVSRVLKTPSWLNTEAVAVFEKIVELLNSIEVLDDLDVSLLAVYCDAYARVQKLSKIIDMQGYTVEKVSGSNITIVPNPNIKTLNDMQKTMIQSATKLGLLSIDRTKLIVNIPKKEEEDPFNDFI